MSAKDTKTRQKGIIFRRIVACVTWVLMLILILFFRIPERNLKITFLDVDQGDGIVLQMPSGEVCLIDGGSTSVGNVGERRIESALKYCGISEIDYAFVSHTDTDHISGLLELLEGSGAGSIQIRHLCLPDSDEITASEENDNLNRLLKAATERNIAVSYLSAGGVFSFGDVTITCVHPFSGVSYPDANAASAVLRLEYGEFSALFTGDLDEAGEKELLAHRTHLFCDLLKVAHHGSRDASSAAFLDQVSPQIAVISAGINNQYRHPHEETLKRLEAIGARTYVTAERGEITVTVDRKGMITVKTMFG